MTNALKLTIASCCLVMSVSQHSPAQQGSVPTSVVAAEERSTRDQDGLKGPVRRVRVETARVVVKSDKPVEGTRVVRGITTYDALGKKIDAVDYAVESNTVPGKEQYRYDDKGNIVEMVVLGNDGSILGKEAYNYEFDPMGNWIKMNTAVAVYENGKVIFEPTEVTYRNISYYYNQAIERLSNTASKSKGVAQPATSTPASLSPSQVKAVNKSVSTTQPVAEKVAATEKNSELNPSPAQPVKETNPAAAEAAKPNVIKVEESVLRGAALDLPQPEYPQAALLSRTSGAVEVQLLVNEKGLVTNARAQGGNPLLNQAAEAAAMKARFAPAKLSAEPSIAFGVITYNFKLPEAAGAVPASKTISENKPTTDQKVTSPQTAEKNALLATSPATFRETQPKPNLEAEATPYSKGVTFLLAGNYAEAAMALNQAIQADPNDANAYVKLGLSYSGMHKDKEAIAGYKMAKQIKPDVFDASAYFSWGRSYLALDKTSDAISAFKQTLSLMRAEAIGLEPKTSLSVPSPEQAHHHLGTAYINAKRFNEAIKEFKQVVALNPANAEAHFGLAVAYLNTGDQRAAQNESKILNSLDPEMAKKLASVISDSTAQMGCRNIGCRR
ncbi:MAG: TonB family protein [Pyrinomonadaceae bacterium]